MQTSSSNGTSLNFLGKLANPAEYTDPLNVAGSDSKTLLAMLESMLVIRKVEEVIADLVESGEVKCPCHLGIGQEAVAVGVSHSLRTTDKIFGAHRSHSHYLAVGGSVNELIAEVFGKVTGCSRGMGGSMHLTSPQHGFVGSVPIVGATIPIATGAALAEKFNRLGNIAVSYFGDGATEEGVFHESLNFASVEKLPVLYVCENNFYSSHLDIKLRQPSDLVARYADAHGVVAKVVDGNDVLAVAETCAELIKGIREGKGPAFVEMVTFRWRGHVGPKEDIDVGVRRNTDTLKLWKKRDPIKRLYQGMSGASMLNEEGYGEILQRVEKNIQAAVELAKQAPYPDSSLLMESVFGGAYS